MAKTTSFTKRALITKANSSIVLTTAVASFVIIFCGIASKSLIDRAAYQSRVISLKKTAVATLREDVEARTALVSSYKNFVNTPQNVIGGSSVGTGEKDGDNAKIALDALPSQYDYPALATSIEKLVRIHGLMITRITGTDDELLQAAAAKEEGSDPIPISMPFQVEVTGSYDAVRNLVKALELSIRPFHVKRVQLEGSEGNMTATIDAQSFYQMQKPLSIKSEVVR